MKTQLDKFDHKIIQASTDNARISITNLSYLCYEFDVTAGMMEVFLAEGRKKK
jgi:hypothetical protein